MVAVLLASAFLAVSRGGALAWFGVVLVLAILLKTLLRPARRITLGAAAEPRPLVRVRPPSLRCPRRNGKALSSPWSRSTLTLIVRPRCSIRYCSAHGTVHIRCPPAPAHIEMTRVLAMCAKHSCWRKPSDPDRARLVVFAIAASQRFVIQPHALQQLAAFNPYPRQIAFVWVDLPMRGKPSTPTFCVVRPTRAQPFSNSSRLSAPNRSCTRSRTLPACRPYRGKTRRR